MSYPGPSHYNEGDNEILENIGVSSLEISLTADGMQQFIQTFQAYVRNQGIHRPMLYAVHQAAKNQEKRCTQILAEISDTHPRADHPDIKNLLHAMTDQVQDALIVFARVRTITHESLREIANKT